MSTPAPLTKVPGEMPPALSQAERVIDTFIAPSKTFTDIRRSASWWLPWLIGAIVGLALVYTIDKKVGMNKVVENQIQLSPKAAARIDQLPPDQRDAQIETQAKITRDFSYGFSLVGLAILAIVAAVLLATFKFGFGAELTFGQAFAISNYAWLPGCIKALLVILTVSISGGENFTFQNQLASNLGAFLDPKGSHFLYSVASSIDVFSIWILVLTGIGYQCVTRLKRGTCMAVVFGWWAVITVVGAAIGSLFS
jgi:hypothetical protein